MIRKLGLASLLMALGLPVFANMNGVDFQPVVNFFLFIGGLLLVSSIVCMFQIAVPPTTGIGKVLGGLSIAICLLGGCAVMILVVINPLAILACIYLVAVGIFAMMKSGKKEPETVLNSVKSEPKDSSAEG